MTIILYLIMLDYLEHPKCHAYRLLTRLGLLRRGTGSKNMYDVSLAIMRTYVSGKVGMVRARGICYKSTYPIRLLAK